MDADERLTALKKGYADIILNTAKEAAARIMLSERKALRFQRELLEAKDGSLRMLLRLKGMMDFKVHEAEATSLSQQRKIEELEAQLQEAEDIVKDLREELGEAQAQLEKKVTNERLHHLDDCDTTTRHGYLAACDTKNSELSHRNEGYNCSSMGIPYACNRDLPSIITRSKEPELYRNGCTQRVRASETNLLDQGLSVSGQIDEIEAATRVKKDEDDHEISIKPPQKAERICNSWYKVHGIRSERRKRKRAARYKKNIAPSFRKETLVTDTSCVNIESVMGREPGCLQVTENETECGKAASVEETVSVDKLLVTKEASGSPGSSEIHVCKTDDGKVEVSSENLETKKYDTLPVNNRVIKYTFQRKRKRESLKNSDGHASLEKSNLMGKNEGNPNGPIGPDNSSLITESSRDSRRLAQVARQLISLSEKKWWQ